ncbi:MAG TPA: hypothetical protein VK934_11020 [Fimbriimonas sp.]|nr:hypothetical protein [Fimbriimonas sp.]
MRRDRAVLLSYLSAGALAALTLFVFWAFQNFGPDSAIRKLHVVVERVNQYLPAEQPFDPRLIEPVDSYEIGELVVDPIGSPSVRWLIDGLIRPRLYAKAKYSLYATKYEGVDRATTVVLYEIPRIKGAIVYVLRKPERKPWQVDASETAKLLRDLRRPVGRF